jgi:hypothetical protein
MLLSLRIEARTVGLPTPEKQRVIADRPRNAAGDDQVTLRMIPETEA